MTNFESFLATSNTIADLDAASAVLGWDQETYMPSGGARFRAEQLATLSTIAHRLKTSSEYRDLIRAIQNDSEALPSDDWRSAIVRVTSRDVDKAAKLPEAHVGELVRTTTMSQEAWKEARTQNDFSVFAPLLERLVELKRVEVDYLGYADDPYDALIDLYEPGMTVSVLRPVFERLREGTVRLLDRIVESGIVIDDSVLYRRYDPDMQLAFAREVVGAMGFDYSRGRIDLSTHPFCTTFGVGDVRLTTRVYPDDLRSCLFGLIHEAGHGMYEQGVDDRYSRTVVSAGTTMGIHESQSLFWENMIGRGRPFWNWAFPRLKRLFGDVLAGVDTEHFHRAINAVKPSLIRIEADDLTYNLHIMIRFEIEHALINGHLNVSDIPDVWNARMQEYLGITPPGDADGCLQDVHWSFAGFGYFPSYTLGKLYAAMFYESALAALPNLEDQIGQGNFKPLLEWLRSSIHVWGRSRSAAEIVADVTGGSLSEVPFLAYNSRRVERLYGLS